MQISHPGYKYYSSKPLVKVPFLQKCFHFFVVTFNPTTSLYSYKRMKALNHQPLLIPHFFFSSLYSMTHCYSFFLQTLNFLALLFLAMPCSMQDLISPTRDQTSAPLHWESGVLITGLPKKWPLCPTE